MSNARYLGLVVMMLSIASPAIAAKYDGTYQFKSTKSFGQCNVQPGRVVIKDGKISGTLKSEAQPFPITGKVSDDGKVKGRIGGSAGRFSGTFANGNVTGKWSARGGCRGEFVIR